MKRMGVLSGASWPSTVLPYQFSNGEVEKSTAPSRHDAYSCDQIPNSKAMIRQKGGVGAMSTSSKSICRTRQPNSSQSRAMSDRSLASRGEWCPRAQTLAIARSIRRSGMTHSKATATKTSNHWIPRQNGF